MTATVRTVPELILPGELHLPEQAERTLPNGLTVIALRRPSVPLVEVRMRIPFAHADLAARAVLARTLFAGTDRLTNLEIAARLQSLGGALSASVDPDRLLISGNALVGGVDQLLELLSTVLSSAAYPTEQVSTERERQADRIQLALSQPAHLARVALLRRVYQDHPYAVQTPAPAEVREVTVDQLRTLHAERIRPRGATLVLVGDLDPAATLDTAEAALGGWDGDPTAPVEMPPVPPLTPGPLQLADRPDAVQSSLRLALPAVTRTHPDHASLQLANLLFGGYFSSRWVENIREDKGYSYGPRSGIEHWLAGSSLVVAAEVATEVTAAALLETWYELGRLACVPPAAEELEQARQYALGTVQLSLSTQSNLAGIASAYAGAGLRLDHLTAHAAALRAATVDEVAAAAARYLAPARAVTVVLGDATKVEAELGRFGPVSREPA